MSYSASQKYLAFRRLQIVVDMFAVLAEKLVARDLHVHRSRVDLVSSAPSVRMVQMRSTLCHGPSWQNIISVGSVGEN